MQLGPKNLALILFLACSFLGEACPAKSSPRSSLSAGQLQRRKVDGFLKNLEAQRGQQLRLEELGKAGKIVASSLCARGGTKPKQHRDANLFAALVSRRQTNGEGYQLRLEYEIELTSELPLFSDNPVSRLAITQNEVATLLNGRSSPLDDTPLSFVPSPWGTARQLSTVVPGARYRAALDLGRLPRGSSGTFAGEAKIIDGAHPETRQVVRWKLWAQGGEVSSAELGVSEPDGSGRELVHCSGSKPPLDPRLKSYLPR